MKLSGCAALAFCDMVEGGGAGCGGEGGGVIVI